MTHHLDTVTAAWKRWAVFILVLLVVALLARAIYHSTTGDGDPPPSPAEIPR